MKIAIVTRQMIVGGVERALLGMLRAMDPIDEVDLYVEQLGGELFEELPAWVHVIEIPRRRHDAENRNAVLDWKSLLIRIRLHFCNDYIKQCELSARSFPIITKEYDMAIAYHAPNTIPMFYTIHNLNSQKKVLWLHGDVETNHMTGTLAEKYYQQYDRIFAVSKQSKDIFEKHFPRISNRCEVFYNMVDTDYLYQQAEKAPTYSDGFKGVRLLTIGRLDPQKGIDLAIEACKMLLECGMSVRWYVCGEGKSREMLEEKISEYHMSEHFLLLGNQLNPYGYLRDCDIYVQTSRFEGYCTATNEARVFEKTVITTDVCGMREQFVDGQTGFLCKINEYAIFETVKKLLEQPELRIQPSRNVQLPEPEDDIRRLYEVVQNA